MGCRSSCSRTKNDTKIFRSYKTQRKLCALVHHWCHIYSRHYIECGGQDFGCNCPQTLTKEDLDKYAKATFMKVWKAYCRRHDCNQTFIDEMNQLLFQLDHVDFNAVAFCLLLQKIPTLIRQEFLRSVGESSSS